MTLAEYQSVCDNMEETKEEGSKKLLLTKEMEEHEELYR